MPDNNAINNLMLGLSIAGSARAEADVANQRAHHAEMQRIHDKFAAANTPSPSELKRKLHLAQETANRQGIRADILSEQLEAAQKALAERDQLIVEWMHSNEAFKRLARQYGKRLGVDDETRRDDYAQHALDASEENPKFSVTDVKLDAQKRLAK